MHIHIKYCINLSGVILISGESEPQDSLSGWNVGRQKCSLCNS